MFSEKRDLYVDHLGYCSFNGCVDCGSADGERSVFITFILVGVTFVLFTGHVTPVMHEDSLEIQVSYWADYQVPYRSIKSVDYMENLQRGSRKGGIGGPTLQAGLFKNAEFGDYMLYTYTSCNSFVVLDTEQGIVVLNEKDKAATKKIYEGLLEKAGVN